MASYDQLINKGGTIFNQGAKVAYQKPEQLAADLGVSVNQIQWGQIKSDPNFNPTGYAGFTPPNPNLPVKSEDLNTNLIVPTGNTVSNSSAFVGSISDSQKYFQDLYNKQTAQFEATQKERENFKKILGESYAQLDTMPDFYRQTEEKLGIPKQYEDLNNINLQIADLIGAYDKEFARVETKGIQSGTPAIFYQGEQAAIQRQKDVEIGALSVRQAAMAGNLDLANQRAAKVTELQFQPIENKIKKTLQFIDINYQDMTAAEKRQADTLQNALTFQQAQLAEQKEIRNMALTSGVKQPYFMIDGDTTVYRTSDGKAYTSEQEFLKDGGNFTKVQTINPAESLQVQQLMKDYGDAGILPSDSLAAATEKIKRYSAKYRKETYIAPSSSGNNSTGLAGMNIIDRNIDASVKNVIAANIGGGYGNTYEAVKKQFGEGVANAYDKVYQSVFNKGASLDAAFNDAKLAIAQAPEEQKKQQEAQQQVQQQAYAKDNIDSITSILNSGSIDQAVGPNALTRSTTGFWKNLFTAGPVRDLLNPGKSNFIADVEKLTSQLTLESLINAKAQGATFGALSEGELKILQSSASKIGTWAIRKDGNVIGYDAKESDFKAELDKINNFAKLDYIRKGGNPADVAVQVMPDGTYWTQNSDGTLTKLF